MNHEIYPLFTYNIFNWKVYTFFRGGGFFKLDFPQGESSVGREAIDFPGKILHTGVIHQDSYKKLFFGLSRGRRDFQ